MLLLLGAAACSGGGDPAAGGGSGGGGGGAGASAGGSGGRVACRDDSVLLQPAAHRIVGDIVTDDSTLYYSQSASGELDGMFRVPKSGGEPQRIGTSGNLFSGGSILLDGDYLYFGDSQINRIKKDGSGAVEMLAKSTGGVYELVADADAIYFQDGHFCCEPSVDTSKTLWRMSKATGDLTKLVTAPAIGSLDVDGEFVYWIGRLDNADKDRQVLMRTPKAGGESAVVFQAAADKKGPNPGSIIGNGLVTVGSELVFSSFNEKDFSATGIYRIAKTAVNGTPTKLTDAVTLNYGFVVGSSVFSNNGDGIVRVSMASGAVSKVACAELPDRVTLSMGHDGSTLFYALSAGKDAGEELRSAPLNADP
jgi:hypothetical protein